MDTPRNIPVAGKEADTAELAYRQYNDAVWEAFKNAGTTVWKYELESVNHHCEVDWMLPWRVEMKEWGTMWYKVITQWKKYWDPDIVEEFSDLESKEWLEQYACFKGWSNIGFDEWIEFAQKRGVSEERIKNFIISWRYW